MVAGATEEMDAVRLMKELRLNHEQEDRYLPKEAGLRLLEAATQGERVSGRCRDARVEDLWSLSSFFGFSTQTFVLAVSLLDRFLALVRVRPKHLSCVSLSCLHLAAVATEAACDVAGGEELIRIGQCRFTVSDLSRMEDIVSRKLDVQNGAVTALTFLHLYHQIATSHAPHRKEQLNLNKLEAQLKACLCRIAFSRAKPSVLALSLLRQEMEAVQSDDMLEITYLIQRHLQVEERELQVWGERVARCLQEYASPTCSKPDHRRLQWVVSRRTANMLLYQRCTPHLPTIPETCWDPRHSEDSCEDVSSSGEESVGGDHDGLFFPPDWTPSC